MKPKDSISFKPGTLGLSEPENLGIVIQLKKSGKKRQVELFTLKGKATLSREKVSTKGLPRFEGGLKDQEAMRSHLRDLGENFSKLKVKGDNRGVSERELTEKALYEVFKKERRLGETDLGIKELAQAWYYTDSPTAGQVTRMEKSVREWREGGTEYLGITGRVFRILSQEEIRANRKMAQSLKGLQAAFRAREAEADHTDDEDLNDRRKKRFSAPILEMSPTSAQEELLEELASFQEQYIIDGKWPRTGPFGPGVRWSADVDWHQALAVLAKKQAGSPYTLDATVKFLIWRGYWSPLQAVGALTNRWAGSEEFPFELDYPEYLISATRDLVAPEFKENEERTDLRHLSCFTIDPATAKDFDDAIGLEKGAEDLAPDQTALWVHIADVSHYVETETSLDAEAYKRATSVYLPDRVLPMVPPRLSDDLCSLRAGVDRYALSVRLIVECDGKVSKAQPFSSIIHVDENLSYPEALKRVSEGNEELKRLFDLAKRMREPREGLQVLSKERKIVLKEDSIELEWKSATKATEAIETFMVAANEGMAQWLTEQRVPMVYRCHDRPGQSSMEELNRMLELAGLELAVELNMEEINRIKEQIDQEDGLVSEVDEEEAGLEATLAEMAGTMGGNISFKLPEGMGELLTEGTDERKPPKDYPDLLEMELARHYREGLNGALHQAYSELPKGLQDIIIGLFLRAAKEAYYTADNNGHFGLASRCYCHFTSPIRRYPDLLVHRQVKAILSGAEACYSAEELAEMTDHCSSRSRQAASFEYRIIDICLALKAHLDELQGRNIHGRIQSMIPGRIFLSLENGSEGALPIRNLGPQLEVDPSGAVLWGPSREGGKLRDKMTDVPPDQHDIELAEGVMRLGERLELKVIGTDLLEGRLEVDLVKKN